MKTKHIRIPWLALVALSTLSPQLPTFAQGTAFNYEGRLDDAGGPVTGPYDMRFTVYDAGTGGSIVAGPATDNSVSVDNGLFTVTLDFGDGIFTGAARWLEIAVKPSGAGSFTTLTPRQALLPTPYAITAENLTGTLPAAQLGGTVGNSQLANNSVTVTAGTGLSGGGTVALGGSTTLNNAGVLSVAGNADITASTLNGVVTLGDTATDTDTASTIVKRDGSGNFSAGTITLDGGLNLPFSVWPAGIIYSVGSPLLHCFGSDNVFLGLNAGNFSMTGNQNAVIGSAAFMYNSSGSFNTANGSHALQQNTSGSCNAANGCQALTCNSSGSYNTANGARPLYYNTSGSFNTANGSEALYNNTTGANNTANGYQALYSSTTSTNNTANGFQALYANTTGFGNTANGYRALFNNTNGFENTASGYEALYTNKTGLANTADGNSALWYNANGSYNSAVGRMALYYNNNGSNNTAVGDEALYWVWNGCDNAAFGAGALYEGGGYNNTAIGRSALWLVEGDRNIALGCGAGYNLQDGDDNIYIGNAGVTYESGSIRIGTGGTHTNTVIAGISGATASGGAAVYVNSSGRLGTLTSSARFKQDIQNMGDASDALLSLRPVTFKYKQEIDPQGLPQFGLVAEEVEKVNPDLVIRDDKNQVYTVRYEAVNAMLLNEFLKEHNKAKELESRLEKLERLLQARNAEQ